MRMMKIMALQGRECRWNLMTLGAQEKTRTIGSEARIKNMC